MIHIAEIKAIFILLTKFMLYHADIRILQNKRLMIKYKDKTINTLTRNDKQRETYQLYSKDIMSHLRV